jgi:tetratricopeptide (TPR) repeat protein
MPRSTRLSRFGLAPALFALALATWGCASSDELSDEERYDIYMTNGTRYYEAKRYPEAEQQARKALALEPDSAEGKLALGWSMLYQATPSKLEAAESHFAICFTDDPSDFRFGLGLGFSQFAQGKMSIDRAEALRATKPTSDESAEDLARAAAEAEAAGLAQLDRARATLDDAISLEPDYPPALACLGQIHMLAGRYDDAIAKFDRYLPIAERSRKNFVELSKKGRDEVERGLAAKKVETNLAKELEVRKAVANIRYKQRRYAEAIDQLEVVLEFAPRDEEALFNSGQCRYQLAEYEEARVDLKRFLVVTLRPFDEMVRRAYDLVADIDKRQPVAKEGAPPAGVETPK